jgi:hypothetical protein
MRTGYWFSADHDFVQILFASGDTRPSVVFVREVDALPAGARRGMSRLPFAGAGI